MVATKLKKVAGRKRKEKEEENVEKKGRVFPLDWYHWHLHHYLLLEILDDNPWEEEVEEG